MTYEEIKAFESKLLERGYKRITQAKAELDDDYEWYKPFRGDDIDDEYNNLRYQIFFCFWNFADYWADEHKHWSVSIAIIPESCHEDVGRRDLHLSVDWSTDIDKVEKCAESFYEFIKEFDNDNTRTESENPRRD